MQETEPFEKIILRLQEELNHIRPNQATPAIVEHLRVEVYGTSLTLQEVATITAPEPQLLVIQPWDKTVVKAIESSIRQSNLHLNPSVDGDLIRIPFPPLTEERRKTLVKDMANIIEEARIGIRKIREELLKKYKIEEKDGRLSEDEYFRKEKQIQKMVEEYNEKIKEAAERKEKELLTIS